MVLSASKSSELFVGFMIGIAGMLTELFFILMVIFFILGQEAGSKSKYIYVFGKDSYLYFSCVIIDAAPADKAYAVFSMFNMIIYFVWTLILFVHRSAVALSPQETAANSKEYSQYEESETYNPAIGPVGGQQDGFNGDQEEL